MSHFLDSYPLDFSHPEVQELRKLLVETFSSTAEVTYLMKASGMEAGFVNTAGPMQSVWFDVLDTARKQDRLRVLLSTAAKDPNAAAIRPMLSSLLRETPAASTDPAYTSGEIAWKVEGSSSGVERIIEAQSTLLDVSFLERGLELSPSVCRLLVTLNDGKRYYGTAFRIGRDLLLTNHHVLFDTLGAAMAVEAWFGYEVAFGGASREHTVVPCRPETIVGRADHDWAVVRTGGEIPEVARPIVLTGAAPVRALDRVYIIQHPRGEEKKIGMIHNIVTSVTDDVIQYRTDTQEGSSGSPVFNEQWQVVGLHHRWVRTAHDGRGEYYNQGRVIRRVVEGLLKHVEGYSEERVL